MTREEAIDILKTHYHKNPRTTYGFKVKQATEMAIEALKERKTSGWNVITKRPMDADEREEWSEELGYAITDEEAFIYSNLPEDGEDVFITTKWGSVTTDTIIYDDCFYFENHDMEDVVAWMPLPKPYKEVDE